MQIGYKNHLVGYQFKTKEYWRNQILLIKKGCLLLHMNKQTINIRKGNIIVFPKNSKFSLECLENYEGLFIVDEVFQFKFQEPIVVKTNPKLNFFYELIEDEFKKQGADNVLKEQYANCILLNLASQIIAKASVNPLITSQEWAFQIKTVLENNAYSNASTEDLLNHLELSYRQLSRCFQKEFKVSIKKYLVNLRIQKAQELLLTKNLSVADIAYELGFSSGQHLSLQFKEVIGLPPQAWLKKNNTSI
jgi:AraC-like DNA-binding protein